MRSFRTKIILTYTLVCLLVVLGLGLVTSVELESYFQSKLVNSLSQKVDGIAGLLGATHFSGAEDFDRLIKVQARAEHIRVTLIDSAGRVVADSDVPFGELAAVENHASRPEIVSAAGSGYGEDTRRSATVNREFLYVAKKLAAPLTMQTGNVAYVRTSAHLEDIRATTADIRQNILVACALVLLVGAAVGVVLSRMIAQPLLDIARGARKIQAGDLDHRVVVPSNDEIGEVALAVNSLVEKLRTDIVQLRKLERHRTEFLGNVSHELRTPIFALQGYIETLLNGAVNDPNVSTSFLRKALDQASRLNALLEDLIDISRIESGEMKMSFRYFRLNEFLESVCEDLRPEAERKHVALRIESGFPPEMELYGDKERLRQVFSNLIANGIYYNKPEGLVIVSAKPVAGGVRIAVKDTGIGIPQEHQGRIFERFYRVDRDRAREQGGTGLGLAIVKHIVEAHRSKVELTSTEGVGSEFSFVLPV
jgi:two-component system phosphate regulon sensor histidine kinase PhoR